MRATPHLPFATLLEFVEQHRSIRGRGRSAHLSACSQCRQVLEELQAIMAAIREGDAGDAPDLWQARAMLRQVRPPSVRPLGAIEAEIVHDSDSALLAGVRLATSADRHWLLVAGPFEIEVTLAARASEVSWPLSGQVFGGEGGAGFLQGASVSLIEEGAERERRELLPTGEFLLRSWPYARCHLRFDGPGWSVSTPLLEP
jgi:hypothetical protein